MQLPRASGVLLHPTSLPSPYGIGELGEGARQFVDFLVATGQQFWQVLPLGPTAYGNSPYMCYSAIAGNHLLISLDMLQADGLLNPESLTPLRHLPSDRVDYDSAIAAKLPLLRQAYEQFVAHGDPLRQASFEEFCTIQSYWLKDYALFMALKVEEHDQPWYKWPIDLAQRKPEAIAAAENRLKTEIQFQQFLQFEFFRQWQDLKTYANKHRIQIIGDIPIYVAHDSADVWANSENFQLDPTGQPAQMAGVPPDYFSETGQLWGNPVYDWDYLQKTNFAWWIQRFEGLLNHVDWIRIDHFRGFEAYWSVPGGETTAMNGEWVLAPGMEFFTELDRRLGKLPILAEDLGVITPEVEALRDRFEFPGMKVLHFAFGSDPGNPFLPFNYPRNCVVYTGTHDNNTTIGWWEQIGDWERQNAMTHFGAVSHDGIHWDLIRQAMGSIANLSIVPLQDILGLGSDCRMNMPGVATGFWTWRYHADQLHEGIQDQLRTLTDRTGRAPHPSPEPQETNE
jgi:4-alpha-glucanotransferase